MDTFYVRIKDYIVLIIERSSYTSYAKIDFRKVASFGLCLKKHIHLYYQLLAELKFDPMHEDKSFLLCVYQDQNSSISNFINETLYDCIIKREREYV